MKRIWIARRFFDDVQSKAALAAERSRKPNTPISVEWSKIGYLGYLWITFCVYAIIREYITVYSIHNQYEQFFKYDLIAAEFVFTAKFPAPIFFCFGFTTNYCALIFYTFYSNVLDHVIMEHLNEIVNDSWSAFWSLNIKHKFNFTLNIFNNLKQVIFIIKSLKCKQVILKPIKNYRSKLRIMSNQNRMQIILLQFINELIQFDVLFVTGKYLFTKLLM